MKDPISLVFRSNLFSFGSLYVLASASAQLFSISGKSFGGMTQSGSGVSDASSSGNGFNQPSRVLIFRWWAAPVSSESKRCTSSGIRTSSTCCFDGESDFYLEELEGASLVSEVFEAEDF
ncbi:hypothetical protein Tco_0453820 [Tanacetum coccineum]